MATTPTAATGANVRAEMARCGVTQTTLARKIGLSQAAVSSRIKGRTPFDINELALIAKVLDVPLDTLLAGVTSDLAPTA